jgi:hypothetical protein
MAEIQVTLNAQALRNLVTKRNYKNKDGQDVEVQEVKFKLVEVKEPKTIFTSDKYRIDKTHFACVVQTKEQREAKADTVYVGEGFTTVWNVNDVVVHQPEIVTTSFGEVHDDLPF